MKRSAFTLLEVLLAMTIAVLLLSALYVAVNTHLHLSQAAREVVQHSQLASTLLTRMSADIRSHLAPVAPDRSQSGGGAGSSTPPSSGNTTPSSGAGGTTPAGTGSTTQPNTGSTTPAASSSSLLGAVQFNYGVQGDSSRLVLYVSRLHRDARFLPDPSSPEALAAGCDLRRITYWLAGGPDAPLGLARQVVRQVTSDELMSSIPPDIADEASYVLAEEVRSLQFSYFDGTQWRDTWDGTQPGPDGTTPLGPPLAIAITIGITGGRGDNVNRETGVKEYRHVVAIPSANGVSQQTTTGQ